MIRQATLDDTSTISQLFRTGIARWQRMDERGQVLDLPYEDLSLYERWLHGGAWMSLETGAIWLNHLASGAGKAYVLENDALDGYAETYLSHELAPFGNHLHIGELIASSDEGRDSLLQHLITEAKGIGKISISCNAYDKEKLGFFQQYAFEEISQVQQVSISAQGGHVGFYKVSEHPNADANQIKDLGMPIGRSQSARQHWETLWAQIWNALPELSKRKRHRLKFNAAGQDAFIFVEQDLYEPRRAEIFCWTGKSLSGQLIGAIRDWAYKTGYRNLSMTVNEKTAQLFGNEVEMTPYQFRILARDL